MPCNSLITNQVQFAAGTDMDLMRAALAEAGYNVYAYDGGIGFTSNSNWRHGGKFKDGMFTATEGTDTDAIKRAYSVQSVKATAKRLGWTLKVDKKNPLKMQIVRKA